jgi:RNA polymerase sigma factor (sigma-70 family)
MPTMPDNIELLRRYAEENSEAALAELVQRYIGFVHAVALRRLAGDAHLAQDVTQQVFIDLARKAGVLSRRPAVSGWLYRSTLFAAATTVRTERRRKAREEKAHTMNESQPDFRSGEDLQDASLMLDQTINLLSDQDRDAVMLRFFDELSFAEIGQRLRLTENAARMKVERATEKLRALLAKRGITSTSAALAAIISSQASIAAPAGLAATVTGTAFGSAAGGSALSILGLVGVLGTAAILGISAAGAAIYEIRANGRAQAELSAARHEFDTKAATLRALEQKARSAEQTLSGLLAESDAWKVEADPANRQNSHAINSSAKAGAIEANPLEEGRRFINSFPQLRSLFLKANASSVLRRYGPFFRLANLSPGQIEQLETLIASNWIGDLAVTPTQMGLGSAPDLTAKQLIQVIGDQGPQEFQAYQQTMMNAYRFTNLAAAWASEAGTPLSEPQEDQLAQIIANNTGPYRTNPGDYFGPGNWNTVAGSTNWDAVLAQAKTVLSPAQFSTAQGPLLKVQFQAWLVEAQSNASQ